MWFFFTKHQIKKIRHFYDAVIERLSDKIIFLQGRNEHLRKEIRLQDEQIAWLKSHHDTQLFLASIVNNQKFLIMDLVIQVDRKTFCSLVLYDKKENKSVDGVSWTGISVKVSDDSQLATSINDSDSTINTVPLAPGSGTVAVNATANYVNSLGQTVSEQKSQTVNYTIKEVPVGTGDGGVANETELQLVFAPDVPKA